MKNKVSISSLNQIFAVPLQTESRWQTAKAYFFNYFYTFIFKCTNQFLTSTTA